METARLGNTALKVRLRLRKLRTRRTGICWVDGNCYVRNSGVRGGMGHYSSNELRVIKKKKMYRKSRVNLGANFLKGGRIGLFFTMETCRLLLQHSLTLLDVFVCSLNVY